MLGQQHAVDHRKERQRDHPRIGAAPAQLLGGGDEFRRRYSFERISGAGRDAQHGGEPIGRILRLLRRVHVCAPALHDGAPEEPLRRRRTQQRGHAEPPGRLAEDGHGAWVAAERRYVVAHPAERGQLVLQSPVPEQPVGIGQVPMSQKPQRPEPVIDRHHHRIAVAHQVSAPVEEHRAAARREAAPVNEDHDRPGPSCCVAGKLWGPDIEREAVFTVRFRCRRIRWAGDAGHGGRLRSDGTEGGRVADRIPALCFQRGSPPQRANRGTPVRDSRERPQVSPPDAPEPSLGDRYHSLHARDPTDARLNGQSNSFSGR